MPAKATVRAAMEMDTSGFDRAVDGAKVKVADFDARIKTSSGNVRHMATLTTGVAQILSGNFSTGIKSVTMAITGMNSAAAAAMVTITSMFAALGAGIGIGTALDRLSAKVNAVFGGKGESMTDRLGKLAGMGDLLPGQDLHLGQATRIRDARNTAEAIKEIENAVAKEEAALKGGTAEIERKYADEREALGKRLREEEAKARARVLRDTQTAEAEKTEMAKAMSSGTVQAIKDAIETSARLYERDVDNFQRAQAAKISAFRDAMDAIRQKMEITGAGTPERTIAALERQREELENQQTIAIAAPGEDAPSPEDVASADLAELRRKQQLADIEAQIADQRRAIANEAEGRLKEMQDRLTPKSEIRHEASASIGGFMTGGQPTNYNDMRPKFDEMLKLVAELKTSAAMAEAHAAATASALAGE